MRFAICYSVFAISTLAMPLLARADMVARWTLDNDTSGLQNLGTDGATSDLIAAPPEASTAGGPAFTSTGGILGGYATFSGDQALVANAAGNAADDLGGYPFTLSAWIRPASFVGNLRGAAVGLINGAAADQYYSIGIETPTEGMDLQAARRNPAFVSTTAPDTHATLFDGGWHHIAVVNGSTTSSRLYLDGLEIAQSTTAVNFAAGVNAIGIGGMRRSAGYIDEFFGDIDEVQIYNEALISSQIEYLFENVVGPPPAIEPCDVDLANGCTLDDLQIIADNFFTAVTDRAMGDLNSDNFVDFTDFRIWKDASGSGASLKDFLAVPEPSSFAWALFVASAYSCARARRSTSCGSPRR